MSAKMAGKQPIGGRKRSRTDAPVRKVASAQTADGPSPAHKRDLPSLETHRDNLYLDAMWGNQMRQLCTEYDNQVHIARVPSAYQALLAPPNPPLPVPVRHKHVRFKSMPSALPPMTTAPPGLVRRAQAFWSSISGGEADVYDQLPK
jgi:hypothetical protein